MEKLDKLFILAFKHTELDCNEILYVKKTYEVLGLKKAYELALSYKIVPFFSKMMMKLSLDYNFWESSYAYFKDRNVQIVKELDIIFNSFRKNSIVKVFVTENFAALLKSDSDIGLFSSGDVDLFADISIKNDLYTTFDELGYERIERFAGNNLVNTMFKSKIVKDFYYSFAWEPLSRTKLPSFVHIDDFFDWRNIEYYKNTSIQLPDKNTLLYIVLLHISIHSYNRAPHLRLYADVSFVIRCNPDLNYVLMLSEKNGTITRTNVSMMISSSLINTPMFINSLMSNKAKKLCSKIYRKDSQIFLIEPNKFQVFYFEIMSSDLNFIRSLINLLLPSWDWMKRKYNISNDKQKLKTYFKHIKEILL